MELGTFDRIRRRCREVAEQARSVRIAHEGIDAYAREIARLASEPPPYDTALHFRGTPSDTVAYIVTLDAVNFGSGYFPHVAKRPGCSGYGTIAQSLTDRFRDDGPIPADVLSRMTADDCARLFGQDPSAAPVAELMGLFARAWNDLGLDLLERFGGSFAMLVDSAGASASQLIASLERQELFRDVSAYRGEAVPFYKRAQILVSDLALALGGEGWGRFHDLDRLTIFADNVVPHVLRLDGILTYEPDLALSIERGDLLPAGSEAEVEIRACALHAVELMAASLRACASARRGTDLTARDLDMVLWNRGRAAAYKATPRHRTRTTAY
jgi:hypothetical protein